MTIHARAAAVAACMLVVACGGGDDDATADDVATAEEASEPDEPEATAPPATTASPATTAPPATTSTTTAPATTTPVSTIEHEPLGALVPELTEVGVRAAIEVADQSPDPMCPDFDQSEGLTIEGTEFRTFHGDAARGPFVTIGLIDFASGDAVRYLDAHLEGAAGPCAAFDTVTAQGVPLRLSWVGGIDGAQYGERSEYLLVRGSASGVSVNSDVALLQSGDRVAYVGYLEIASTPDAEARDAIVAAMADVLDGVDVESIDLPTTSASELAALLPGLDELGNDEVSSEANNVSYPDPQCPGNPTTINGLDLRSAAARRFLDRQDEGPHVTISLMEFGGDDADRYIDRWVAGAEGPCAAYDGGGFDFGWTLGSAPQYLDRTVTFFGRGKNLSGSARFGPDVSGDYVLVRSGNYVAYVHSFLRTAPAPNVANRDRMVQVLVDALEQLDA